MRVSSWLAGGLLALAAGATTAAAQTTSPIGKGSWLVGGAAGFSHTSPDGGQGTTNVSFSPLGLYFVAPHLALGGTVDLAYQWSKFQGNDTHDAIVGVEPTIRYFFGDLAGKTFPYLNGSIGPSWNHATVDGVSGGDQTVHGLDITGSAGLMHMLSTHVGLTGELYYTHRHLSNDFGPITSTSNSSNYGLRFGFSAFVF